MEMISGTSKGASPAGHIAPRTLLGAVSVWSIAGFLVLFAVTRVLVRAGVLGEGGTTFFSNPMIAIPMVGSALLAAVALVLGVVSFIRGERSVLVALASVVGFGVTAFTVAEVVGPPA